MDYTSLAAEGLLNKEAPDLSEMGGVKMVAEAFCSHCHPSKLAANTGIKKEVSRNTMFCPDCGYALLWKTRTL